MEKFNIPVYEGTVRPKRKSIHAARFITEIGNTFEEVEAELIDPKDFDIPLDGNNEELVNPELERIAENADGFFIVTPEYNHGYPGTLKKLLDNIPLDNYIHKPVAIAGVSSGGWGGTRVIEALVPVVRELGLQVTFTDVNFPNIKDVFDQEGELQDEAYIERAENGWKELIWMAKVLKHGRENVPSKFH